MNMQAQVALRRRNNNCYGKPSDVLQLDWHNDASAGARQVPQLERMSVSACLATWRSLQASQYSESVSTLRAAVCAHERIRVPRSIAQLASCLATQRIREHAACRYCAQNVFASSKTEKH
jgi:hypothetical protein